MSAGAILGEFVGARYGIGHVIQLARGLHDVPLMYSAIIVVLVLVLLAEYLMTIVENRFAKWKPQAMTDMH